MKEKFKKILRRSLLPHGKDRFLMKINPKGSLLDVGCGNNSPLLIKSTLPNIHYTGLDIGDYNQSSAGLADRYIICEPEKFADTIASMPNCFDAIISAHNLEHCNDREKTLDAMLMALKPNGYLYMSFPTEKSINFPSRPGTLNYYDDETHQRLPPDFNKIPDTLKKSNIKIIYATRSYKPFILYLIGFFSELVSKRQVYQYTWAYYGFESIKWARK